MKNAIKGAGANVAFSAAFKYLEKDPVKNLPKLLKWADNFTKGNRWNSSVKNFQDCLLYTSHSFFPLRTYARLRDAPVRLPRLK